MMQIINRRVGHELKPAYEKIVNKLRLRLYNDVKSYYDTLR